MTSAEPSHMFWAKIGEWTPEQAVLLTVGGFPPNAETNEGIVIPEGKEARYEKILGLVKYDFARGLIKKASSDEGKLDAAAYIFWCKIKKPKIIVPAMLKKYVMQNYKSGNAEVLKLQHGKKYATALKMLYVLVNAKFGEWITEGQNTDLTGKIHAAANRKGIMIDETPILERLRDADKVIKDYKIKHPEAASSEFE